MRAINNLMILHPEELTKGEISFTVKRNPSNALQFLAKYLTKEQMDQCIKEQPNIAVLHALEYISQEQFKRLLNNVNINRQQLLKQGASFLTPEMIDELIASGASRLIVENLPDLITPTQLDVILRSSGGRYAYYVVSNAAHLLTPEQLDFCIVQDPAAVINYAFQYLTLKQLLECINAVGSGIRDPFSMTLPVKYWIELKRAEENYHGD